MSADETDETTVYVAAQSKRHGVFHLSEECHRAPTNSMPRDRKTVVEKMDLRVCKHCDPDHEIDNRAQSRPLRDLVNDPEVELGVSD